MDDLPYLEDCPACGTRVPEPWKPVKVPYEVPYLHRGTCRSKIIVTVYPDGTVEGRHIGDTSFERALAGVA